MESAITVQDAAPTAERSAGDLRMRRLLRLPSHGPKVSIMSAQNAFSKSIAISATRCLVTYVALPLLAPIVDLTGVAGPILGIILSLVSMVAIAFSVRRFFAADHKWRWGYTYIAGGIFVLLIVQLGLDAYHLAT